MPTAASRAALAVSLGVALLLPHGFARAQVADGVGDGIGASVTLLSNYLYRGASLSDERPTLSLDLSLDGPSGGFAGASFTGVTLGPDDRRQLQALGYAGYAGRLSERLGWEAGALASFFSVDSRYDYAELFTGLNGEEWNLRLHYAPDYFGSGTATAYGEWNLGIPLTPLLRATAHAGGLRLLGAGPPGSSRTNLDGSVGLAFARDAWELKLDWVVGGRNPLYPTAYGHSTTHALVLAASLAF